MEFGLQTDMVSGDGKLTNKLRRSCEACRISKSRCLPSKTDSAHCARCLKGGKSCVFLEIKPRPKKMRSSKVRVAEIEQKMDGILTLLAAKLQEDKQPSPAIASDSSPDSMPLDIDEMLELSFPSFPTSVKPSPFSMDVTKQGPFFDSPIFGPNAFQERDCISKGLVTASIAEDYLRDFESCASTFPFVVVPPHMSLENLRVERPFLLLGILASTSQKDTPAQDRLENELRENLSRRVIMWGEKSIDLLQGLLVYLAWYHHHYNPKNQQFFQLTQMANSMAIDLGLHRPRVESVFPKNFDLFSIEHSVTLTTQQLEEKRTLVGCYCLTSSICRMLRRPNNLRYHDYIQDCSQTLSETKLFESDALIPYFTRMHKLGDDIDTAFDYSNHGQLANLDPFRIEILNNSFAQQFQEIQRSFPSEVWNNVTLMSLYYHTRIYANEIGLHALLPTPNQLSTTSLRGTWYDSPARTEALIRCLQSSKEYLDIFLSFSPENFSRLTSPDYLSMFYSWLILARFTEGCDSPNLNQEQLRQTANMRYYNETFIDKFNGMLLFTNGQVQKNNSWNMKLICIGLRAWYRKVTTSPTGFAEPQSTLDNLNICFTEITSAIEGLCTYIIIEFDGKNPWHSEPLSDWSTPTFSSDYETAVGMMVGSDK